MKGQRLKVTTRPQGPELGLVLKGLWKKKSLLSNVRRDDSAARTTRRAQRVRHGLVSFASVIRPPGPEGLGLGVGLVTVNQIGRQKFVVTIRPPGPLDERSEFVIG